jgi:16S rRNA G966 N2-methylase RsmD
LLLELSRSVVTTLLANMRSLKLDDKVQIQNVDTIRWLKSAGPQTTGLPKVPWIIFCCPPYSLWRNDGPRLIEGLENLMLSAPQGSQLLCETEDNYDLPPLMPKWSWDVRHYKPASVSIARKYSQNPEVDGTVDKP